MSVRTNIVTAVGVLAAMIALPAEAQVAGTWHGVGLQAGPGGAQETWDIVMTVRNDGGDISYPSLGCTGRLKAIARSARETEFRETITSGSCIDGGRIVAQLRDGRVFWFWSKPSEQVDASAVLYRSDQVAEIRTRSAALSRHPTS